MPNVPNVPGEPVDPRLLRPCANAPRCRALVRADVGTLHCDACHASDPALLAAAAQYRRRVARRLARMEAPDA